MDLGAVGHRDRGVFEASAGELLFPLFGFLLPVGELLCAFRPVRLLLRLVFDHFAEFRRRIRGRCRCGCAAVHVAAVFTEQLQIRHLICCTIQTGV